MRLCPRRAGAARAICRWWRSRRARSSGWSASTGRLRTCCRCHRCRRGCCSMRFMMRRLRTSIRCSLSWGLRGRSRSRRWKPRWRRLDLSLLDEASCAQRLANELGQDRGERFDLSCAPLMRFTLIRLSAQQHRLVLTHHHLLMDGWSLPVLVRELLTLYERKGDGAVLARVTPYRDYLAWLAAQDRAGARAAWQQTLAGVEEATHVAAPDHGRTPVAAEQITLALSQRLSTALSAQARRHGLTLNTFMQAAWGLLLGR